MFRRALTFVLAGLMVACATGEKPRTATLAPARPAAPTSVSVNSLEQKVIQATNAFRDQNGLAPLKLAVQLIIVAQNHARNMARQDKFGDNSADRSRAVAFPVEGESSTLDADGPGRGAMNSRSAQVNSSFASQLARCCLQRAVRVLGIGMVACFATSFAAAQDSGGGAQLKRTVSDDGAVVEVPVEPIVIESDALTPEPTQDQLMQKFRDALGQPPSYIVSERQLAGGVLEVTTRFGRLCVRPLPGQLGSGLGGDITLAAPCASF
jgi:hypothetical protein